MPISFKFKRLLEPAEAPPPDADSRGPPDGYDPHWRISADPRALELLNTLSDEEKLHAGLFLSRAKRLGFTPDQVQEMWCEMHTMAKVAINMAANHHHTQEAIDFFLDEEGWDWLMRENGKNLRLYFWVMKQGVGARR